MAELNKHIKTETIDPASQYIGYNNLKKDAVDRLQSNAVEVIKQTAQQIKQGVQEEVQRIDDHLSRLSELTEALLTNKLDSVKYISYNELYNYQQRDLFRPGQLYGIVDYCTLVSQENVHTLTGINKMPVNNLLIVEAISPNTLSENAKLLRWLDAPTGTDMEHLKEIQEFDVKYDPCWGYDFSQSKVKWTPDAVRTPENEGAPFYFTSVWNTAQINSTFIFETRLFLTFTGIRCLGKVGENEPQTAWEFANGNYKYYLLSDLPRNPLEGERLYAITDSPEGATYEVMQPIVTASFVIYTGYIYHAKDKWGNEAPYDFGCILKNPGAIVSRFTSEIENRVPAEKAEYPLAAFSRIHPIMSTFSYQGLPITICPYYSWGAFRNNVVENYFSHGGSTLRDYTKTIVDNNFIDSQQGIHPSGGSIYCNNHIGENSQNVVLIDSSMSVIGRESLDVFLCGGYAEKLGHAMCNVIDIYGTCNTVEYGCSTITLVESPHNTISQGCGDIFMNTGSRHNKIGNLCRSVYLQERNIENIIEDDCYNIMFGNDYIRNVIHAGSSDISFRNSNSINASILDRVRFCNIGNMCTGVVLYYPERTISTDFVQNIEVEDGIKLYELNEYKFVQIPAINNTYKIRVGKSTVDNTLVWNTADLAEQIHNLEEILLGSQVGKSSISILFVGNSLTQDGIAYLPYILKNYYPEIDFRIYMWYVGGYTLEQQYDKFISDGVADVFSVAENSESWTNYRKDTTMSSVLSSYRFDIVCMQEYFNYKTEYTAATDWNNCRDYIVSNYQGGNALEFISLFHAPLRKEGYDVHEVYEMTERGNALILQDTISEDMIPNGIAVYRALDTELNNLGDLGQLSPDGTHTQEGLPCLLQTYVTLCWLFDRLRINKSIYGHPMRMTTAIYNTISVPGANLGTGVVQGTDAQYLLAQEVAIKAYKEGKQFVTRNLYPYEWGGGSALIQCTFSITTNISGATIKINGIEQSSVVVLGGSTVNWEVSKDGYETQRGSETIGSDTTRSVELMPIVSVTSISAEFNQGERTIFDEQDLDDLREYLVVHVNYVDGTRKETDAYTLSGTLTDGANTITVSFGGKETTFVVEVRSVVIPEGVTRYGWVAYYKDSSPASSELKTPSNFIYLNAYEDMNELSAEFTIGKKPNVNVVSGPALLGARLSSSSNTRPWYGIYVPAELGGLRVDIRNHAGAEFIPWPSDVNKFKLVIDNRSTSPAYAYTNEHETGVELPWTTSDVIPYGMSLFNNIPNGSTSNMGFNHVFRLGDIIFRDYGGKCVGYYVPAVSEGKIGMFDIITQTFCTAQTTSVVTVGNSDCIYKVGNW